MSYLFCLKKKKIHELVSGGGAIETISVSTPPKSNIHVSVFVYDHIFVTTKTNLNYYKTAENTYVSQWSPV